MIKILNPDLFRIEIHQPSSRYNISVINLYLDPKIKVYEYNEYQYSLVNLHVKTESKLDRRHEPFASIVIYGDINEILKNVSLERFLANCHSTSLPSFVYQTKELYKSYADDCENLLKPGIKLSNVIYAVSSLDDLNENNNYSSEYIIIGAIPIKGNTYNLSAISKQDTDEYMLYEMVVADTELLMYEFYNYTQYKKIMYVAASIDSSLTMHEYISNSDSKSGYLINHEFYIDESNTTNNMTINYLQSKRRISKVGRERLFVNNE